MYLTYLKIKNHPILNDVDIDLRNPTTGKAYSIIAFVGENGCGKTTLLNEIFNYQNSKYFIFKENERSSSVIPYSSLFLRQNSLARSAMSEIGKAIDGKERFAVNSDSFPVESINKTKPIENKERGLKLLELLNDIEIYTLFKEGAIGEVACGNEILQLIDEKKRGYDISNYSSGQQEILLKLKDLFKYYPTNDSVLLDEPETSLHPRWQLEIVDLIRLMLTDINQRTPQIFLATHSEKVLESLIKRDDVLIVRLFKRNDKIIAETINEMNLCLPTVTFAELDYVVFHIPSLDYHDHLFTCFGEFFDKDTSTAIDLKIERKSEKIFGKKNIDQFKKERVNSRFNKIYVTKMLPTYIRDYFHHPSEIKAPTEEELVKSIELMRALIKYMKEKGFKEAEETD
ncbi:MAG: AAA family ATPase [Bacilli bacterium]|nr:AAA family ATPase [Bacilli bacterium]